MTGCTGVKDQRPDLNVIVNGGITSLTQASSHLEFVDGVDARSQRLPNAVHA